MGFDKVEAINIFIASIIGLGLSYVAAYTYEQLVNKRNKTALKEKYKFLESVNNTFDWQHWDINNGKISDKPIDAFMRIKYSHDTILDFEWIESSDGKVQGNGKLIMDDIVRGRMYYFRFESVSYDYRDVFFRQINLHNQPSQALFVNAKEEGTKYVMIRKLIG